MAKKRREPQRLTRMPSGAQQYVREGAGRGPMELRTTAQGRMNRISEMIRNNPEIESALHEAFMDEVRLSRAAMQNESQGRDEGRGRGYASGGMVRGYRPAQRSGKKFQGSF